MTNASMNSKNILLKQKHTRQKDAALKGIFNGEKQVYLHAKEKRQILDGIDLLIKNGINVS